MFGFHSISERPFSAIELITGAEQVSVFSDGNINVENILGLTSPATQEGLMNGIVAYWKLDETGGLSDFNTVLSAGGMFGNAASFYYGSKEYLYIDGASATAFNPNNSDFSISAWWYFDRNMPFNNRSIFSKTISTAPNWSLKLDSGRKLGFSLSDGSSAAEAQTSTGFSYETWYYTIAGYDSKAGTLWLKVYDTSGSILHDVTTSYAAGGNISNTSSLIIGAQEKHSSSFGETHWWGQIDEVGFWDKTLTSSDISELINSGSYKTFPVSNRVEIEIDSEMSIEYFIRGLVANAGYPISFLHETGKDLAPPIAFLSNIEPILNLNLDWKAPIDSDGVLDIEWVFELGVQSSTYIGFLQESGADSVLITEIIETFGHSDIIPISFGGTEFVPGILKWTLKNDEKLWTLGNNANTWVLVNKNNTWTLLKRGSSASTN